MHTAPDSTADQGAGHCARPALSARQGAVPSRLPRVSLKRPNTGENVHTRPATPSPFPLRWPRAPPTVAISTE